MSKCLGFAACRWNGTIVPDKFVESLKGRVDFVTACPEADMGLGIPRDPIKIVIKAGRKSIIQLNTKRDITKDMEKIVSALIASLDGNIDGFILKDRSPSCGLAGFFGGEVVKRFGGLPVETEARLKNKNIRKRFLAKLFA